MALKKSALFTERNKTGHNIGLVRQKIKSLKQTLPANSYDRECYYCKSSAAKAAII